MKNKTIVYLVGKQGSGKTKLVQAFNNAIEFYQPDIEREIRDADAGIFIEAFKTYDYVIVSAQERQWFTEFGIAGICQIFEFKFINAEITTYATS